ncbi:hypothetical protein [Brevibacterium sp.]|uniref:hypothetical protein n=1 Tax=Brevibacterium sp. TaxID=1701 RepID=UPI002810CF41|nr:hypothetical protein [Brevibacterium sp.]
MDDRINALLSDLEAMHSSQEVHARRGELAEELAAQAAERTLVERLRGSLGHPVQLRVAGREVAGTADFLGAGILVVTGIETVVVSLSSVVEARTRARRHQREVGGLERLGMGSALRRLSAAREELTIVLTGEGGTIRGHAEMVASDYLEIAGRIIPHHAIALVSARINPFA